MRQKYGRRTNNQEGTTINKETMNSLKIPIITSQDLSSGSLSYTTSIGRRFKLENINIHFSVAVTETITITRVSSRGSNYNVVLVSQDLSSNQDYVFRPKGEENEYTSDEIKIECTDANGTGICYVELKTSSHLQ